VERHHRERSQIEKRIKDHKLGVSLRRLPLSDLDGTGSGSRAPRWR